MRCVAAWQLSSGARRVTQKHKNAIVNRQTGIIARRALAAFEDEDSTLEKNVARRALTAFENEDITLEKKRRAARATKDDVERISWGKPAKRKGTGSRGTQHAPAWSTRKERANFKCLRGSK